MQKNKLLSILLCAVLLFSCAVTAKAEGNSTIYTVAQVNSLCDGIVAYNGAGSGQDFIDRYLCDNAGVSAEFYAIALSQSGNYRFDRYESALLSYLRNNEVYSATSREKYALALAAAGSTDGYISHTADEAIGGLGMMSLVFGLHLLNNGYDSDLYSTDGLVSEILSWQKDDGGWAVMGSWGDVDVTAMTLQALAPYYGSRGDVSAAADRAIELLSDRQLESGGFKTMGAENCESAAQVIIALSALGIDAQTDGRFIKNGCSVMDAMMSYSIGDGSFAHTDASNANATLEAFCALTAYSRFCYGRGSLYLLDHVDHAAPSDNSSAQKGGGQPQNGGSGSQNAGSQNAGSGSAALNRDNSNHLSGSGADNGADAPAETDSSGNRIIVINGQRYIEATNAAGEKVRVSVDETQPSSLQDQAGATVKPTYGGFQPGATADMRSTRATADENGSSGGYKIYAVLGVAIAFIIACAVLFALKKRGKKHYIAAAAIAAAAILFILLTDFKSADSYRRPAKTDGALTVTLSIRCDTLIGREKVNDFIPDDGVILDTATYTADEGDTVFDVLMQAVSAVDMPLDNRGAKGAAYIAGINCLYEFDYGDLSGWMYRVNGEFPDVGCQSCTVSNGDVIEWLYTTDIGKDLE